MNELSLLSLEDIARYMSSDTQLYNATSLLKDYFKKTHRQRRIDKFLNNSSTRAYITYLMETKGSLNNVILAKRGKKGKTDMCYELFATFYNWLHNVPKRTCTRSEVGLLDLLNGVFHPFLKFEGQYPCMGYRIDMYCKNSNLAVEYDEEQHSRPKIQHNDILRQQRIESILGCKFIRIKKGKEYEGANRILHLLLNEQ